jgi:uncharacterized protein
LKAISKQRRRVEAEPHLHRVRRGWRGWLHWENLPWLEPALTAGLKAVGLWNRGQANALAFQVRSAELTAPRLPAAFDGLRLLWISDLHLEPLDGLIDRVLALAAPLTYDLCVLGGDYSFDHVMTDKAGAEMQRLAETLLARSDVYAILGNHDCYAMAERLDATGVQVLINDHALLRRRDQSLALIGVDDCHYYRADDLAGAAAPLAAELFKVLLCHSPEQIEPAAAAGIDVYLAGHTHGGQICLPNGFAPVTCASVPRRYTRGLWRHNGMVGYTSRGAGASGVPVRFNCPGEITLLTFRKHPVSAPKTD